jgi:DNA repair exonuclease SbcCD ATPase subunit
MAQPFILKNLAISRMPGFDRGMKAHRDFAAQINLISGPNASGKSSTARMIRQLIWRDDTEGIRAKGSAEIDGKKWDIHINSHSVMVQREGIDTELKGLPAKESGGRYELALHKLVLERDEEIAMEIARLASGGYNLGKAEEQLGYASRTPDRRLAEYTAYNSAREERKRIEQRQQQLKEDESRLQQLKHQLEHSSEAKKLLRFYELVIAWKKALQQKEQAATALTRFPAVLERATGRETGDLKALESAVAEKEQRAEVESGELRKAKNRLQELRIPEEGISNELLQEMEQRISRLGDLEREITTTSTELEKSVTGERNAAAAIGPKTDPEAWDGIALEGIGQLDQFLLTAHKTISAKQYLESAVRQLEGELKEDTSEPEKLRNGIAILNAWITSGGAGRNNRHGSGENSHGDSDKNNPEGSGKNIGRVNSNSNQGDSSNSNHMGLAGIWLPLAVAAAGLAVAVAVSLFGNAALWGILIVVALALLPLFRKERITLAGAERELRRGDYEKTGLPKPERWEESSVTETIEQLQVSLQAAMWQSELRTKREQYKKELSDMQPALDELNHAREQLLEKLGAATGLPGTDVKDYTQLYWFIVHVREWQQQRLNSDVLRATAEKLRKAFSSELATLNTIFEQGGAEKVADKIAAKALFDRIREEEETRRRCLREIATHGERLKELETELARLRSSIQDLYGSLELENGDKNGLLRLMEQLGEYRAAAEAYRSAVQRLNDRQMEVTGHSIYADHAAAVEAMTIDEAEGERMRYETEAAAWESRTREIAAIEAGIGEVRSGNSLEEALLEEATALEALKEAFEGNLAAATGKLLTDQLRADTYGNNPSEVYVRANELFSRITSGRYGLRIDEQGDGGFRAYDNTLSRGQELEELSTGTRIQLLLSVRLAYIEQQEEGLKLPVLADELLANCDDTRAAAIIEALIAISKEGRQVFYFTAQADEVAKWKYYLEKEQVEHRVFELNGGSGAVEDVDSDAALGGDEDDQGSPDHRGATGKSRPESENDSAHGSDSAVGETEAHKDSMLATRGPKREPVKFFQEVPEPGSMSHEAYGRAIGAERFDPLIQQAEQIHLWYILEDTTVLFECMRRNIRSWGQLNSFVEHGGSIPGLTDSMLSRLKLNLRLLKAFIAHYRQGRPRPIDIVVLESSGAVSPTFIDAVNTLLETLGDDPVALIDALKNKEVPGFRENKINELEEYLTAEGFISLQERLDTDEIIRRLHATFPEMEADSHAVERVINRII